MQALTLYLVWDSECETSEEDVVMEQLFSCLEKDDSDDADDRKAKKHSKDKKRKKRSTSSSSSSEAMQQNSLLRNDYEPLA